MINFILHNILLTFHSDFPPSPCENFFPNQMQFQTLPCSVWADQACSAELPASDSELQQHFLILTRNFSCPLQLCPENERRDWLCIPWTHLALIISPEVLLFDALFPQFPVLVLKLPARSPASLIHNHSPVFSELQTETKMIWLLCLAAVSVFEHLRKYFIWCQNIF